MQTGNKTGRLGKLTFALRVFSRSLFDIVCGGLRSGTFNLCSIYTSDQASDSVLSGQLCCHLTEGFSSILNE